MDTVFILGLRATSVIGCYDWERDIRQTLVIDLKLKADFARAAETDALTDALDYAAISKRVIAVCDESRFQLLEALAEHLATLKGASLSVDAPAEDAGPSQAELTPSLSVDFCVPAQTDSAVPARTVTSRAASPSVDPSEVGSGQAAPWHGGFAQSSPQPLSEEQAVPQALSVVLSAETRTESGVPAQTVPARTEFPSVDPS